MVLLLKCENIIDAEHTLLEHIWIVISIIWYGALMSFNEALW